MKLLDTNIFIYAAGRPHAYKEACARLLQPDAAPGQVFAIDAELLQEILYVYDARGERARGLQTVDDILVLFPNPQPIGRVEISVATDLMTSYPQLSPRDAIHAAVAVAHNMEGIVSADKVFDDVSGVMRFDPLSLKVVHLESNGENRGSRRTGPTAWKSRG